MIDFLLSESGDIVLEKSNSELSTVKLSFCVTSTQAFKFSFFSESGHQNSVSEDGIKLSFKISRVEGSSIAKAIVGKDALSQKILVALQTELGDIDFYKLFGSRLYSLRHKKLFNKESMKAVKEEVLSVVSKFITEPQVDVEPYIDTSSGYKQCMHIRIKSSSINEINYIF